MPVTNQYLVCWELNRSAYTALMGEHPDIGNRLLTNLVVEMSHRIMNTSDQLRELES